MRTLRQPRRLLRALGEHVGVPGAAQGPAHRRRPRARRGLRRRRAAARVVGRRPDGFVEDVQAMRRRVEQNIPAKDADRQLKLGPGGLRDVEFAVQLLQLVHGRSDVMLRSPTTLAALEALATWGYVGREDAAEPWPPPTGSCAPWSTASSCTGCAARTWCPRTRRTCAGSAASMGFRSDPVRELDDEWRRHAPRGAPAAREAVLPPAAERRGPARRRRGAAHPRGAREHGWRRSGTPTRRGRCATSRRSPPGSSARAAIQRTLLPVMLGWFADAPDPDAGLLGFRRV